MKKIFVVLSLIFVLSIIFIGCEKKEVINTVPQINEKQPEVQPATTKEIVLDKTAWKNLNIFFSNFSEAEVPAFSKDNLSNNDLIMFGIHHIARNDSSSDIKRVEPYYENNAMGRISAKHIESSVEKYFGKKITKHETVLAFKYSNNSNAYCTYKDGYYILPQAETEIWPICSPGGYNPKFSQISKLIDNGNNYYTCYVNIYSYGDNFVGDPYAGTIEDWKKDNSADLVPTLGTKMKATIKKESDGRYILIDYLQDK